MCHPDMSSLPLSRFGYVVMFGWCWPLAAVCALANNMFEVRSDLFKLITSYQRLPYHDAADIGAWLHVLQFMSMAGGECMVARALETCHDVYIYAMQ